MPRAAGPIAVIGAGLAGSLAALALARRGASVTLVGPAQDPFLQADVRLVPATSLSYGSLLGRSAIRHWRRLERLHGPLGLRRQGLVLHGWPFPLAGWPPGLLARITAPLPFARVDPPALMAALPGALAAAGVHRCEAAVALLERGTARPWRLRLEPGPSGADFLEVDRVVLAAGVGSRTLWPALPARLRFSWAGVLALSENPGGSVWLEQARRGRVVQPRHWRRPALEAGAADQEEERWIVDAGLAPWGEGVVVGQISLVRPGVDPGDPPDPGWMERRLRQGLAGLDGALADLEGPYRQVAVPFCTDGRPLVGPVEGTGGLWVFSGFSGAFTLVPALAEELAEAMQAG